MHQNLAFQIQIILMELIRILLTKFVNGLNRLKFFRSYYKKKKKLNKENK